MKNYLCTMFFCLFLVGNVEAYVITADATGLSTIATTDYWGVSFDSGVGYIQSVSFDVSPIGAHFDFGGAGAFANATEPIIGICSGLQDSNITTSFNNNYPVVLNFQFTYNSFGSGDSFRFSADTDGTKYSSGDMMEDILFSVKLQNGQLFEGAFAPTGIENQSKVTIKSSPVPLPSSIFLISFGLLGITRMSRKTK